MAMLSVAVASRIPLLLVGDGPQEATGLGRIARDLGFLVTGSDLPLDLVQVGGSVPPCWTRWPHVPMGPIERGDDWGASFVEAIWHDRFGQTPGVLWVVWDPARCYAYHAIDLPVQRWCYTAIDSHNRWGGLSGPPAVALAAFDRVLAYGRWGSEVIKSVREGGVSYLPHGLWLETYHPPNAEEQAWVTTQLGPYLGTGATLIGCVATNQARKDLALYFETLALLKERGRNVHGWLHTDTLTGAWSVTQLVEDCGLQKNVTLTLGTMSDRQLACLYQRSDVTIAPGLGEGFGYPIVESLAAGVPVVHGDFGGGSELVPKVEWRVPMREYRTESVYALRRPVFRAEDVANAVERALGWRDRVGREIAAAYCRGAVAHLDWQVLAGRWTGWIRKGL
jgi:glycosyltransferase involved in cell wall biosynthesis